MPRSFVLVLALMVVWAAPAWCVPVFTGHWRLDVDRSSGLSRKPAGPVRSVIEQNRAQLTVKIVGQATSTAYRLDGSDLQAKTDEAEIHKRSRWAGDTLVTEGTEIRRMLGTEVKMPFRERRWLERDGAMVIETTVGAGAMQRLRRLVYVRDGR